MTKSVSSGRRARYSSPSEVRDDRAVGRADQSVVREDPVVRVERLPGSSVIVCSRPLGPVSCTRSPAPERPAGVAAALAHALASRVCVRTRGDIDTRRAVEGLPQRVRRAPRRARRAVGTAIVDARPTTADATPRASPRSRRSRAVDAEQLGRRAGRAPGAASRCVDLVAGDDHVERLERRCAATTCVRHASATDIVTSAVGTHASRSACEQLARAGPPRHVLGELLEHPR